jgi:NlpC/P60 family putative phage cell wall peptidase
MNKRDEIVQEARKWLGTPYRAQAHVLGVGVDCVNLVNEVLCAVGAHERRELPVYRARPNGTLQDQVGEYLNRIPIIQADTGDVLLFKHPTMGPSHLALLTSKTTIIHAYMMNRRVIEHSIDDRWRKMIAAAFRAKGVE